MTIFRYFMIALWVVLIGVHGFGFVQNAIANDGYWIINLIFVGVGVAFIVWNIRELSREDSR